MCVFKQVLQSYEKCSENRALAAAFFARLTRVQFEHVVAISFVVIILFYRHCLHGCDTLCHFPLTGCLLVSEDVVCVRFANLLIILAHEVSGSSCRPAADALLISCRDECF